jgi:hypothetical protein
MEKTNADEMKDGMKKIDKKLQDTGAYIEMKKNGAASFCRSQKCRTTKCRNSDHINCRFESVCKIT